MNCFSPSGLQTRANDENGLPMYMHFDSDFDFAFRKMVCAEFSFIDTADNEVKIGGRLLEGAKSRPCQKDIENFDRALATNQPWPTDNRVEEKLIVFKMPELMRWYGLTWRVHKSDAIITLTRHSKHYPGVC